MPELHDLPDPTDNLTPEELPPLTRAATEPTRSQLDPHPAELPSVSIPLEDVTAVVPEVNQPAEVERVSAVLRTGPELGLHATPEEVATFNERVKRDFTEQVLEARRQAAAPPPPPQPVAPFIMEQTKREMARGAQQSAYWAEQQKLRPAPSERDRQAAGMNTPVFQPERYTNEKGEGYAGKDFSRSNMPSR